MQQKILQGEFEKRNGIYYEYDPFSKPLGEGGMGVVYKGFRVNESSGVRQVVAIKAMKDGLPDEVYARARREASIKLKNDNLVEMMGFISINEQEQGGGIVRRYYVISEFLNGVKLTDLLKGNFKDVDGIEIPYAKQLYTLYVSDREVASVQIVKRVLSGIMALHDKGYIHRDIDPSNIMVTKDGNLKMIDFGIAKDIAHLNTNDGLRTSTGKFIGKAEYAAPELVLGDVHNQNLTTDIYAIGILFYQLMVGKLPFDGPQYDVLQNQLKKNVPVGNIPFAKYRSIVKKATSKEQTARYQSCVEMRLAIDTAKPGIDVPMFGKIAAAAVIAVGIGWGAYHFWPTEENKELPVISQSSDNDTSWDDRDYQVALSKLNSEDSVVAKQGLEAMSDLVKKGCQEASYELMLTYAPLEQHKKDDVFSTQIQQSVKRHKTLSIEFDSQHVDGLMRNLNFDSLDAEHKHGILRVLYSMGRYKPEDTITKNLLKELSEDSVYGKDAQERLQGFK